MTAAGLFGIGDFPGSNRHSPVQLSEDGRPLQTSHAGHDDIRAKGNGRYSHWQSWFWFAASDNSNPNTNGRRYGARVNWDGFFTQHARLAAIHVRQYLAHIPNGGEGVTGRTILELGPGSGTGTLYAFAALGARVIGLDPYPQKWSQDWHIPYMQVLARELAREGVLINEEALCSDDTRECVSLTHASVEKIPEFLHGQADIILSTAVLEHVEDMAATVAALAKASKPGALGIHIVDFRDHRDASRPLEYMLLDDEAFEAENKGYYRYVIGNRQTLPRLKALLERGGFHVVAAETFLANDGAYVNDILARIRTSRTRFRDIARPELEVGIGTFVLTRAPGDRTVAAND
ncbi:hypothetical protein MTBSS4_250046 [Magnetospirillum sp. SS-4]|nr:hypothetical protein MTBSS4_250046 [Magnetospirillum sp. SS-4]